MTLRLWLLGVAVAVGCADPPRLAAVQDPELGFAFDYRVDPDGYVVSEAPAHGHAQLVRAITLVRRDDVALLAGDPGGRDGPPSIEVRVYRNPGYHSAFVWPLRFPGESHIELAGNRVAETVVGGANAARYLVDGLYPTDTVVVASGGYIYLLTGAFDGAGDPRRADFDALVASFRFVPPS